MSGGLKVTIAGLDFYGQGLRDFVISPDGFSGWDDGVDMRLDNTVRPQGHGSFDLPGYQDARTVAISGTVFADSNARLRHLRSRLTGVLAGGQPGRIQVDRDGDVQWADCRLASKTMFTESGGQNTAKFQIQLWCPDPRKFGESRSFPLSGSYTNLFHYGNYNASPVVTVTGNAPAGYTIGEPGGVGYQVTGGLLAGQTHTIDFRTGVFRINGKIINGQTGITDIWFIEPGVAKGMRVTTAGTVNATATVVDTYI